MSTSAFLRRVLLVMLVPALAACERDRADDDDIDTTPAAEETAGVMRVTGVDLGRSIGADRRIADDTDDFAPADTIYASVATEGAASGSTLTARWTFEDGQVVDETTQTVSPSGPAATEFHISRPGGLPAGRYNVEILLNGESVERKDFEVRAR